MKQTDSSIIIVRNVCVLTSASMIVYLFFTRSWSAIIGTKQPKVNQSPQHNGEDDKHAHGFADFPREEKINNHGCWGKHIRIPDNDYWGICLFHVVWTNFFLQLFLCGTHGIYFYLHPTFFSSTEQCAWVIISPKEFKSWVTRISFALLYGKTELSAVKYFAICS
jgi:hypothetical protein